jgi:hypothetical protein
MGQLRWIVLPAGPHRDLVEALRELHLQAGLPSVRAIARLTAALSHDTVHRVLVGAALPSWGPLELVVEALGGDVEEFRVLWMSARRYEAHQSG